MAALKAELQIVERKRDALRDDRDHLLLRLRETTELLIAEQQQRVAVEHQLAEAHKALQMVLRSLSWKVSAPLRSIKSAARRIRGW